MGYDLHIVRQSDYDNEEENSTITLAEWLEYVAADPELKLTNGYEMKISGMETIWQERPGFCAWIGRPQKDSDTFPWLDYDSGSVRTKNPDNLMIGKMINISVKLNAKVRGDHFEYYDENYLSEQEHKMTRHLDSIARPWWKFW